LFADSINEATSGKVFVNDLSSYTAWQNEMMADDLAGKQDHTFTFLQRALWIQTGECVPLLS